MRTCPHHGHWYEMLNANLYEEIFVSDYAPTERLNLFYTYYLESPNMHNDTHNSQHSNHILINCFSLSHLLHLDGWHQCTAPQMPSESEASNSRCWGCAASTGTIHEAAEGWRHAKVSLFLKNSQWFRWGCLKVELWHILLVYMPWLQIFLNLGGSPTV